MRHGRAAVAALVAIGAVALILRGGDGPSGLEPLAPLSAPDASLDADLWTDRCTAFFEVLRARRSSGFGEALLRLVRDEPEPFAFLDALPRRFRRADFSSARQTDLILRYEAALRDHVEALPSHPLFGADRDACLAFAARAGR